MRLNGIYNSSIHNKRVALAEALSQHYNTFWEFRTPHVILPIGEASIGGSVKYPTFNLTTLPEFRHVCYLPPPELVEFHNTFKRVEAELRGIH